MSYRILIQMQADVARLQRDVEEARRVLSGFSARTAAVMKTIGASFAGVFSAGLITQAAKSLAGLVKQIDDIDEAAQGVGTTAVALAELRQGARLAGLEAVQLEQAMSKLVSRMDEAASGNKDAIFAFKQLGVEIKNARGDLLPTDKVLEQIADRFRSYRDGSEKAAAATALFGERVGRRLVPFLNQGSEGLRVNIGLTDEMVQEALRANKVLDELAVKWERLKVSMAGAAVEIIRWIELLFKGRQATQDDLVSSLRFQISQLQKQLDQIEGSGLIERWIFGDKETRRKRIEERIAELRRELQEAIERPGLDRFIAGSRVLRDQAPAAPSLRRNVEGEQFIESLRKRVQSLELTETQLLRIEARQKGVAAEAEKWLRRLEDIRIAARNIEQIVDRIAGEQAAMATAQGAIGRGAGIFADVVNETDLARMTEFQRRIAETKRQFSELRAIVATSGLTGDDLSKAIEAIDQWSEATIRALREQQEELRSWSFGWNSALRDFVDEVGDSARTAQRLFSEMTQTIEDAFVQLFTRGTLNVRRLLEDIAAMLLRAQFGKIFAQLLGSNSIADVLGFALRGASGRAGGGPVSATRPYIVGERGPELFVPNANGSIVPSMGGVTVHQTIYIDSRADRASIIEAMEQTRRKTIADIQDAMRRRGASVT